jgi:opacity protein-like surface antigen
MRASGCLLAIVFAAPGVAQTTPPGDAQLPRTQPTQQWTHEFSGYFKDLASGSRSYFTQDAWGDNLDRLRLSYDGKYRDWFGLHVDYDNEFHAGNLIGLSDFETVRGRQSTEWLDLQRVIVNQRNAYWDTSLYRGYVSLHAEGVTLTAGRQRIGWGTAHFWSPMDMFNPISPLQIEPQERQGADAALLEFRSPGELRWSLVYAPQDGFRRSISAARLSRTIHNYDFDVVAARFGEDWTTGLDFAGQLGGAGLRGEVTYRWRHAVPGFTTVSNRNTLRMVVGSDYAFVNGLYVVGEYFYNQGQPDPQSDRDLDLVALLQYSNEIFTLHRHFISVGASYPLTPLWKLETYVVTDLAGPSAVVLPRLSHNLAANADLNFGGQLFYSSRTGEFQGLRGVAYLEVVIHFR